MIDQDEYGLDDIFNNPVNPSTEQPPIGPVTEPITSSNDDFDVVTELLKSKGINDPSKIKFENDAGEVEERNWDNLTAREQYNIINSSDADYNYGLDEDEVNLINGLRTNNLRVNDFISYVQNQAIQKYVNQNSPAPDFTVDQYSDDELYQLDMQARFPDMSEEDIISSLEHDKENESYFERKMNALREEYKNIEIERTAQVLAQQQELQQQQEHEYQSQIVDALNRIEGVGAFTIEMEDRDMQDVYDFLTRSDTHGVRHIAKALNNPDTLVKMAWFAIKGDEAMKSINEYYAQKIKEVAQSNYEKGMNEAKSGKAGQSTLHVRQTTTNKNQNKPTSIDDLYTDLV